MKRFIKSTLGVTLLEIMLVLAIAAMVIVMSVRYYQSANSGQQANSLVSQISTMVAAADSLAQSTGAYTASAVTSAAILSIIGGGTTGMNSPWGTTITLGKTANTLTFSIPATPGAICSLVKAKLAANNHYTISTACGTTAATMSIVYTSNP